MVIRTAKENQLSMIRGTTKVIHITIMNAQGQKYLPLAGDVVRFGVKAAPDQPRYLIQKSVSQTDNGIATIILEPEDTIHLPYGEFKYDVGLESEGMYFNIIPCSDFILCPNITGKE